MALVEQLHLGDQDFPTESSPLFTELVEATASQLGIDPYYPYGEMGFEILRVVAINAVIPVASCLGIITNMLNLVVLKAEGFQTSNNVTIFNLAISDFVLATFSCLMLINYLTLGQDLFLRQPFWYNLGRIKVMDLVIGIFDQTSRNIATLVSVDRFLSVTFPFQARHFITPSRVFHANVGMWVVGFLVLSPHALYLATITNAEDNSLMVPCNGESADRVCLNDTLQKESDNSRVDSPNINESENIWPSKSNVKFTDDYSEDAASKKLNFLFAEDFPDMFVKYFLTPFRCLMLVVEVTCTVGIVFALRKQRSFRKKMKPTSHGSRSSLSQAENRNAKIAIGIGVLYMFTNSEIVLYIFFSTMCSIEVLCAYIGRTIFYYSALYIVWSAGVVNCFSSFFLYMALNKKFKAKFLLIFCRYKS